MRGIIGFLTGVLLFFFFINDGQAAPAISSSEAILMDANTGEILYEKDAFESTSIASITKIMTALLAIESNKLEEEATVSRNAVYTEGSSIYLEQGEQIKVKDLVYGLMLRSGNDAAVAIAEHIGESEEGFVYLMNERARWLGMDKTKFENPHGLDAEEHYSSAHDIAILTKEALNNEVFQKISGSVSYLSESRSYSWRNKHKLVTGYYEYATGGKTGYTKQTGRTLVTTAEKDDDTLIVVTLDGPNDWNDHISLFEWGFSTLKEKEELQHALDDFAQRSLANSENQFQPLMTRVLNKMVGIKRW